MQHNLSPIDIRVSVCEAILTSRRRTFSNERGELHQWRARCPPPTLSLLEPESAVREHRRCTRGAQAEKENQKTTSLRVGFGRVPANTRDEGFEQFEQFF